MQAKFLRTPKLGDVPYAVRMERMLGSLAASIVDSGNAPALLAGNAVVVKPSEIAPLAVSRAVEAMNRVLPPGVLQVVIGAGETGAALVDHVDMVCVTGSSTNTPVSQPRLVAFRNNWTSLGAPHGMTPPPPPLITTAPGAGNVGSGVSDWVAPE